MLSLATQVILPFLFSALIVILITIIAEKYGTKIGGILGTLPSTIVIAFLFISYNKGVEFTAEAVAVVPAELGINLFFLFIFALLVHRSAVLAYLGSIMVWMILSFFLYVYQVTDIVISLLLYSSILFFTFVILEFYRKIPSAEKVIIHYTTLKIILRGILAGFFIALAVLLSNLDPVLSGIFSVFPAILSSTMIIFIREHGPKFAAGMAKSMIFGISSVCLYAIGIHFFYPYYGIVIGTIISYLISALFTLLLFTLRNKIR